MIGSVNVIGSGRVGSAVSARLVERGLTLGGADPDLVLLCVPDRAIAEVAAAIAPGPWVAHVSGATPLAALAPHTRRFGVHPLQTFTLRRGPEQLDGAWAAVTAESDDARAVGTWLAETLASPVCPARREPRRLPRRRLDRVQLPRHAPSCSRVAARRGRCAARGARSSDGDGRSRTTSSSPARSSVATGRRSTATSRRSRRAARSSRPLYRVLADATAAVA